MKYVKLTARPDTWFKAGTEVYHYDAHYSEKRRFTLEEFIRNKEEWRGWTPGSIGVRGIRVCDDHEQINGGCLAHYKPGDERIDGEWCCLDEFDLEIVEDGQ